MSFRRWVFVSLILLLSIGACHASYIQCGWTTQQYLNCLDQCAVLYQNGQQSAAYDCGNNYCLNCKYYSATPTVRVVTTLPTLYVPRTIVTTEPATPEPTPTPDCQAMYSSCIQNNCPGTQGNKACYDSCQYNVEAEHGSECVLVPGKMISTGKGNAGGISGNVQLITPGDQKSASLNNGDVIPVGSQVLTNDGYAKITFEDGSTFNLGPHTTFNYGGDGYRLTAGTMRNFATCSLENLAPGSFACPPIFSPVARFAASGGTP